MNTKELSLSGVDPSTRALEAYIEASVAQILTGATQPHQNALLFLSAWHEAMPALVHLDPVLEPVDSRVFAVLWIWGKQQGRGSTAFPSYEYLLKRCNVQSRSTLARSLAILRITRWITLCRRVRDQSGRNRGNIYALHEEPLALPSTLYLDPDYMEFLHAKTGGRPDRVRRVTTAVLASLQQRIDSGEDVLAVSPLSPAEQRLEAVATIAGHGGGCYFWLRQGTLAALETTKKDSCNRALEAVANRVQKLDSGRVHISNSASVQNLDSYTCSSSSLEEKDKTTTATTTTLGGRKDRAGAHDEPSFPVRPLFYPESLSPNEQRLAAMYLIDLDAEMQQALLDELADKIKRQAKTDHPVRNPIGLLAWMCAKTRAGQPPLTSAHLQHRDRRERERRLNQHLEAEKRRLTEMAKATSS